LPPQRRAPRISDLAFAFALLFLLPSPVFLFVIPEGDLLFLLPLPLPLGLSVGLQPHEKSHAEGVTALPKAEVQPEGRNDSPVLQSVSSRKSAVSLPPQRPENLDTPATINLEIKAKARHTSGIFI